MNFPFSEKLLHYIWSFQLFDAVNLQTKSGKPLCVLQQGFLQPNAGPDFANAKIQLGNITLVGNLEIHVLESSWNQHGHEQDEAYNNVILHVVWQSEKQTTRLANGQDVEILELKNRVNEQLLARYDILLQKRNAIPCSDLQSSIHPFQLQSFLQKLTIERLERKVNDIQLLLDSTKNDWNQVLFILLARYLGRGVNNEVFQQLASSFPIKLVYKNQEQALVLEALLFGQSGLLHDNFADEYPIQLFREYQYQKRLHNLTPIQPAAWKYSRLHSASFPAIRMAQLAAFLSTHMLSIETILGIETIKQFNKLWNITVHPYWNTHYDLDKKSKKTSKHTIGKTTAHSLLINFLVPVLFAYGKQKGDEDICEKALHFLETAETESNSVVKQFSFLTIQPANASDTQALIELKTNYCDAVRCLDCAVGNGLLAGT